MDSSTKSIIPLMGDVKAHDSLLETPLAAESLKLSSWDPAVFATDVLETQVDFKKDFEQTSRGISVAYSKIMST
jgi:hypothetical protein